ncbi:fructokinase [Microbacterium testaceum StLB037]|uniref:Fructokinase n=1 Tax=Microbacterium testaceum (strain StLB037) TaxID=979556 RepID=A0A1H0QJS0_MICTS|nr:ROK family protein [Microbacterium testaceum]SDP16908.1 fructokinase [Microbacterium testaceum StLB037]
MTDPVAPKNLILGLETGGTKVLCAVGAVGDPTAEVARWSTSTRSPQRVLADIAEFLAPLAGAIRGVGIAAFGPLDLDCSSSNYGAITTSPKTGWDGFALLAAVQDLLPGVPCLITTDVAGAAYGEAQRGALRGARDLAYVTIGTGVGLGLLQRGELMVGTGWPEAAHIPVQRHPDDAFAGVCRFHGDCLEGLASGPAIAARNLELQQTGVLRSAKQDLDVTAFYIAQLIATLYYCFGSERVVLGGGVMKTSGLIETIRWELAKRVGPPGSRGSSRSLSVELTALDGEAGLVGALLLAGEAAEQTHRTESLHAPLPFGAR